MPCKHFEPEMVLLELNCSIREFRKRVRCSTEQKPLMMPTKFQCVTSFKILTLLNISLQFEVINP